MKIVFFGSDKYSQIVLTSISQDKNIQIAKVFSPTMMIRIIIAELEKIKPEVGVLASFGKIVPPEILTIPKHGILNLHPSLLPKYRGPTPAQTTILNEEKQTGLTIIKMDKEVDHGPIVAQFKEEILPTDTAESLYFRLFSAGAEVLKTILPAYLEGRIKLRTQNHSKATYTKKLTREDGKIDWKKPPKYIERMIRAFYPWPGCWTKIHLRGGVAPETHLGGEKRLKILKAHLENGKLVLDQVQLEGKKPVAYKQFLEGYPGAEIIY